MLEYVICNLCKADDAQFVLGDESHRIVKCKRCGLMYANPRRHNAGINGLGSEEYLSFLIREHTKKNSERIKWCKERLAVLEEISSPGRMLDVGCSAGFFLDLSREKGWLVTGIDPSYPSSKYVKEEFKLKVFTTYFDEEFVLHHKDELYDAITFWNVLEHLPDPYRALCLAGDLLRPNGILAIEVPNMESPLFKIFRRRWYHLSLNNHLYFFTKQTLQAMVAQSGFQVISVRTARRTFPLVISRQPFRNLSRVLNSFILWSTNSGDVLIICVRKRMLTSRGQS
jgi:2-polyprenyl-3-methyl-5-hydroxy-6-metoxy-1,4-benzoquinol methylase